MSNIRKLAANVMHTKIIWPITALAAILLFNLFFVPGFFNIEIKNGHLFGSLIDILNRAAPIMVIAIGMTLVIAKEGIDISVGSVLAISGAVAISLLGVVPLWMAIVAAMVVGVLCGLWNGVLIAYLGIQPMVGTLILMTVGRGIAQLITEGKVLTTDNAAFGFIGKGFFLGLPFSIFIAAFVFLFVLYLKKRTALGLFLEATGSNKISSEYAGLEPRKIYLFVYIVCGLCAAIAGLLVSSNISSADANNAGLWIELDAILAVVIGGTSMRGGRFFLAGTVIGALFIQSLTTTIYSMGVPPERIMVVKAIVVIVVSLMQSDRFRRMFQQKNKQAVVG
ncbi:simple sugar transport system permease protein [Paenibacillus endophyticus]|uniref:Simple sugar transport system permease protein n=1 Tax=Paenibacillus endophyticus TaxID=1294268 RepID=A0A7W5G954_9BACL|nr:ABC transporter permease [Paenibacillus endophyticus]MBB3151301.1 simple sugar transport system permease protein [Paenibacillus endophyticus]